jgi:hypothetical protein
MRPKEGADIGGQELRQGRRVGGDRDDALQTFAELAEFVLDAVGRRERRSDMGEKRRGVGV